MRETIPDQTKGRLCVIGKLHCACCQCDATWSGVAYAAYAQQQIRGLLDDLPIGEGRSHLAEACGAFEYDTNTPDTITIASSPCQKLSADPPSPPSWTEPY